MNILFLTITQLENIKKRGLYSDLLHVFYENKHNLYIVSAREKRLNLETEFSNIDNVKYLKVKVGNITKTNFIEKGISTITLERKILKSIKKYYKDVKFDLIIYSIPPITFNKIVRYIKKRDNATTYLLLKDIFPQNAVDLNVFSKKSPLYYYFRQKEKQIYKVSDYIGCMSKKNVEYLLKSNRYLNKKNVEICPNTITPIDLKIGEEKKKELKEKYSLPLDKNIFIYGGNLGKPQGIDFIIEVIKSNETNQNNFILIVGAGTEFNKLQTFLNENKIKNTKLLNFMSKEDYDNIISVADVGLIFLDKRFTIPNFPSRLLSYMEASIPVLAATDVNTDFGEIMEREEFGLWCETEDLETFMKNMKKMENKNFRNKLGLNGNNYLLNNYTSKPAYEIIMKHFKKEER